MALLKFKRSAVPAKVPALNDLALGELAINTYDGKVYTKKDNGTASIVEVGGGGGVTSFNTRTGAVTLSGSDVTTALGYTPANKAGDTFTGLVTVSGTGLSAAVRLSNTSGGRDWRVMQKDDGRFVIADETAGAERLAITSGGAVTALTDIRAPIFYDSNNTSYYVDPAGGSRLGGIITFDGGSFINGNGDIHARRDNGTTGVYYFADGGTKYLYWDGGQYFFGGAGSVASPVDFRAPIFYDSNNTGYYLDPASTGTSLITAGGVYAAGQVRAAGWWGEASASATGLAVEIGESGGRCYITAYSRDAAAYGPMSIEASDFTFTGVSGGFVGVNTSVRAPIFYDSENTARFVDPSSTSVLNVIRGTTLQHSSGQVAVRLNGDTWTEFCDVNGATKLWLGGSGDPNNYYNANIHFFRNNGAGTTMTIDSTGLAIATASYRAPIFYDSGNSAYYLDPNGRSNLSNITVASGGTESGIRFRGDTLDFVGRYSNYVSLFNANGPEFKLFDSGYAYLGVYGENGASWRAPIFYDTNDTGRYLDPNSTSSLYRLSSYIAAQDANANWNTGFQNTPAYSYNYHGDLNGGTNAPAAGWWFYESMRHSNASNYWGTQIAWGWEDNANRMLQRNVTGNSFGGWVEYLNTSGRTYNGNLNITGSIISTASDVRAPIFYDQNDTSTFINPNGESWIKGDFKLSRVAAGGDNDCFGGLELREVSLVGAAQSAATYAPRLNFHWGSRAAATIYMDAGGSFVFGGQGNITSNRRSIFCNELYATGNVTAYYSDDRLKTRIGNIENALDIVSSLNGFRYVDNDLAKTFGYANENGQIGVSAQEVQKHLPEIVRPAAFDVNHDNPDHGSKTGENYLTVDYSRLVPLLIEAIKELRGEVEALKNRS